MGLYPPEAVTDCDTSHPGTRLVEKRGVRGPWPGQPPTQLGAPKEPVESEDN